MKIEIGSSVSFLRNTHECYGWVMFIEGEYLFVAVLGHQMLLMIQRSAATLSSFSTSMPAPLEQLRQLQSPVWDGNLMSKDARDKLVGAGLVDRACGWNILTAKGATYLADLGFLRA